MGGAGVWRGAGLAGRALDNGTGATTGDAEKPTTAGHHRVLERTGKRLKACLREAIKIDKYDGSIGNRNS